MVIKNRLFPYPVLSEDTDDYREGSFRVVPKVINDVGADIDIQFDIELDNPGIQALINNDKAVFVIHIECTYTSYRDKIVMAKNSCAYHLPKQSISGYVNFLGMVVAKDDIYFYNNPRLDSDYDDIDIHFDKGAILAYYNIERLNIYKHYEELTSSDSIFSLCKKTSGATGSKVQNIVTFDINSDRIKIFVDEDIYNSCVNLKGRDALINSSLVLPAMIFLIEQLREQGAEYFEDCQSYMWYKVINDKCKREGSSLEQIVCDRSKSITQVSQELLGKPINNFFSNIDTF